MNDEGLITSGEDRLLDLLPVGAFLIREDFVVVRWNRPVEDWHWSVSPVALSDSD